jgi:transposase
MARERIMPNGENCSMAELDGAVKAAASAREQVRLRVIKALLLGITPAQVAELFCVTDRSLLTWIKAFNLQGIEGLLDKERPGRPRAIGEEHVERLCDLLLNPTQAELAHWTAKKFHGYLRDQLAIECGYSTLVRWLHEHQFRLKVPQPWPDRQDEQARAAWLAGLCELLADNSIDLWYMDEMGVEGDPRPRRRWAKIGEKTRVTKNGDHLRMNVTGMICPRTGQAFLLEFTHNDREIFQAFLDEANQHVATERPRNVLICDNASWHKCKSHRWGKFEPLFLPAYSPDLNPIERLWLLIKAEWFSDFVAKDHDALVARLDQALNWAMARGPANQKTCPNPKII